MDVILEKIIEKKAKELNISKGTALEIYKSIFFFIKKTMAEGEFSDIETFKSIYIKDLGIIYPNKKMIPKIQSNIEKKKDENI